MASQKYDISKSKKDSTNGRFHAAGFKKHHEGNRHVFTLGKEVLKFPAYPSAAEEWLDNNGY